MYEVNPDFRYYRSIRTAKLNLNRLLLESSEMLVHVDLIPLS